MFCSGAGARGGARMQEGMAGDFETGVGGLLFP